MQRLFLTSALALTLTFATAASAQYTPDNKTQQQQVKQDYKADKSQAKADKAEGKALKSKKVRKADKAQDKADREAAKAGAPPQ